MPTREEDLRRTQTGASVLRNDRRRRPGLSSRRQESGAEVRDRHRRTSTGSQGLKGKDAAQHLRHRAEDHPGQEGLPGHQGRPTSSTRSPRSTSPVDPMNEARWYPTLDDPRGRPGPRRLRPRRHRPDRPRQERDLRPEDQEVDVPGPHPLLPHLPGALPDQDGKLFYPGSNAGYGPDDEGRDPGRLGPGDATRSRRSPGLQRRRRDWRPPAPVLLPPAQDQKVHGARRRRGRRVREVHRRGPASSTSRTDNPTFEDGPDLPRRARAIRTA